MEIGAEAYEPAILHPHPEEPHPTAEGQSSPNRGRTVSWRWRHLVPAGHYARLPEDVAGDFANERFIFDYEHGFCRMQPCLNARHQFWNRYRSHKASKSTESHCIAHSILRGRHV